MGETKRAGRKGLRDRAKKSGKSESTSGGPKVKKAVFESTKKKEVGVSDLTLISKISNEAINDNLKKRFENREIYTYIGHVLISVNPFRDLGIYTDEVLESYKGKNRLEMPPHVFAIAESAYYNMNAYKENQCVIISGESGAGKTEAAKRIMQYIANVSSTGSSSIQEIKDMVLATNPLLESFGCAKTLRNNNSSRHGKYLEIQFNAQGEPVGASITNYLLEKGRVVGQIKDERNFHIFYQFTKAASENYRTNFGIQGPETYLYTNKSKCFDVDGIDDTKDFADTLEAMRVIGLSQQEQDEVFRCLAIILWLGNIQFKENDQGNSEVVDSSVTDFVAYLLGVDAAAVDKALTERIMETSRGGRRGSVYEVPLNPAQAASVRDALAKAIYNNLFEWIVDRVNVSMKSRGAVAQTIGILDIYGFEIFETNSFEQLCINYVNEKLQQIFIQLTLRTEQEEYAREQIQWTPIKYFDNKVVCELIEEKRPPGVFAALNDACATAHADPAAADQTFVQRLNMLSSHKHFEPRQGQFLIKHYAGDVMYSVKGMTEKNKDQLLKDLLILMGKSDNPFLHTLFPEEVNLDNKKRPPTAGDKIKQSANDLVNTLTKAHPSYIRTIKPNENKSPTEYNVPNVLHQIKYLGLQENVRIRRAGFAYRQTFEKFVERFYLLSSKTSYAGDYTWTGDARSGVLQILKDTSIPKEEYQMGVTKAFIKTPETLFALEHMRDRYWHNMAIRIQRAWRAYVRRKVEAAIKIQRFWRRIKGGLEFIKLRDYGHEVLGNRKERRRYSLVGYRRFLGDYLGVGMKGGPGELIKSGANISSSENVLFSCRAEILVSKLGRSSKPSPRVLVLTNKAVYIVIQQLLNGQLSISAERVIPIGSIKYVSMSNLSDDWFALGVGSAQEPDPFLNCIFKTEFVTHLKKANPHGFDLKIGQTIEYSKKPGKIVTVKAVKDTAIPGHDLYKSSTIHVKAGEAPNSVSKPTPRPKYAPPKRTAPRSTTNGAKPAAKRAPPPQPRPIPQEPPRPAAATHTSRPAPPPQPASRPAASRPAPPPAPQPAARVVPTPPVRKQEPEPEESEQSYSSAQQNLAKALGGGGAGGFKASHTRNKSSGGASHRAPPPPPPPPQPVATPQPPAEPTWRAKYDFNGEGPGQMSIKTGEILIIVRKEDNGWWLSKKISNKSEGWVPTAYLEEAPQAAAAPPAPPPPPTSSRPTPAANGSTPAVAKAKPAPPARPSTRTAAAGKRPPPAVPARSAAAGSTNATPRAVTPNTDDTPQAQAQAPKEVKQAKFDINAELAKRRQKLAADDDDDW